MKEEREVIYLIKMFNSELASSIFKKSKKGTKRDFEIVCNAPENNTGFRRWIDFLINRSILSVVGYAENKSPLYGASKKKILKRLEEIEYYRKFVAPIGKFKWVIDI